MDFMLNIDLPQPPEQISYRHPILLTGSCFSEHIGNSLGELKFDVLQNPNGILFDAMSVAASLVSYVHNSQYSHVDLVQIDELWHSWAHHSRFSGTDPDEVVERINASQRQAHDFLMKAEWIIITLGSSFSYRLVETGMPVANCHRAPAQAFRKHMMTTEETCGVLDNCLHQLTRFNPRIKIIFTISPVRHIRDGVVDNNRSKARLLEAVHQLVNKFDQLYYFPAYELVIDVLRDYRFYDIDMVHPNYAATQFVLEKFSEQFLDVQARAIAKEIQPIVIARKHRPFQPGTDAHRKFLQTFRERTIALQEKFPFLPLGGEIAYFGNGPANGSNGQAT